jgi:hypothetical protein
MAAHHTTLTLEFNQIVFRTKGADIEPDFSAPSRKLGQDSCPAPRCQFLVVTRFPSMVSTTGTLVPSGKVND